VRGGTALVINTNLKRNEGGEKIKSRLNTMAGEKKLEGKRPKRGEPREIKANKDGKEGLRKPLPYT